MAENMQHWTPRPRPEAVPLEGRYVRLEKLEARHAEELYAASAILDADAKFTWLPENPPEDLSSFRAWVEKVSASTDPIYFAIIDKATGKVAGRQTLMRIDAANGAVEIGNIYWGPLIARKAAATEALFLFAQYAFDTLGYRRFEWKCNNDNVPSKKAALRFGFQYEGLFRQHFVIKGLNRDTAWFAMIDKDWVKLKPAYEAWLAPENFDANGGQKRRLEDIRADFGA
ncbi:MAG: GNAT family protein [Cypionkella sp.]|uniref:GNAT family N-acetyltransferase n=1 Tax=Cypionkella sp. TaxID=2811411 RepID=UPI002AB8C745|nr:GNAT family protein [Cypionkella sp.]MDZ4310880.1 GNAT family protein [Cypionkella sp.]MDZ4392138.1 GNAT family protein [Cypionkella sp.]